MEHDKNDAMSGVRFIDLFAGIGGFHFAMRSFGAECVFASEWDKHAQDTYETNHGLRPVGDITRIDEDDIPPHDIICGGFPCQAFSISGKRLGFDDARGTLFFDVARIAKRHAPKMLFLENVKNFAAHDGGRTATVVKNTLEDLGYNVHMQVLNASRYGVPQARERIYILAFRKDIGGENFSFPEGDVPTRCVRDIMLPLDEARPFIVRRNDVEMRPSEIHPKCVAAKPVQIGKVNKGGQGERIYHPLGQGITLSAYGGGAGAKTGLYLDGEDIRKLAPRECARMLGLSDNFKINPNKQQAYKQFGNSVVVDVLQHIIYTVLNDPSIRIISK